MHNLSNLLIPGIVLLLTLATGVWLSRNGKPFNGAIFNLHKLIALGAVILSAVQLNSALKNTPIQLLPILLLGLAGACMVALFASGALMSVGKPAYTLMLAIHRAAPFVLVLSLAAAILLLNGGVL